MEQHEKQSIHHMWLWVVGLVVVVASLGAAIYFYADAQEARQNSTEAVEQRNLEETERVVGELGEILLLTGDSPTVARIEEPEILKSSNPDFYKDIQAGDYLVLYPQRAIVYRSSERQIINIAPIVNTQQFQQTQQEQSTQPEAEGSEATQQ